MRGDTAAAVSRLVQAEVSHGKAGKVDVVLLGTVLEAKSCHTDNKFGGAVYTNLGSWDGHSSAFLESPLGRALQAAVTDLVKKTAATKM